MLVAIALPGMALAVVLARIAGAGTGQCVLAALAGAALAALLIGDDRTLVLTVHVVLVVGAIVAILVAPPHGVLRPHRAVRAGGGP